MATLDAYAEQPDDVLGTPSTHSLYASRQRATVEHAVVFATLAMHVAGAVVELPTQLQNVVPHVVKPRQLDAAEYRLFDELDAGHTVADAPAASTAAIMHRAIARILMC